LEVFRQREPRGHRTAGLSSFPPPSASAGDLRQEGANGRVLRGDGLLVRLAAPDSIDLLDRQDEDLTVPNLTGASRLEDRLDRALDERLGNADLESHLLVELHLDG